MLKITKYITPVFLLSTVLCTGIFSGCNQETGCTDRIADNYNPDVTRDDGSCINARDKFLGVYNQLHICWPDTLLPQPRFMTIAEDQLREQKDDVKLLNFGADSIVIRALISKELIRIPRQDLNVKGLGITFWGEGHIDDKGSLTILYSTWLASTGAPINVDCVIFAQRFDN